MSQQRALDKAVALHQAGELELAERAYRDILALPMHPDEADAMHLMGLLLSQQGENERAREMISRAIELDPLAGLYRVNLGTLSAAYGLHEEAVTQLRRAAELNANVPVTAILTLAQSLAALGRMDESADAFEWAVRREKTGETLTALGEALLRSGNIVEAFDRLNEAVLLKPDLAEAHAALALAYEKKGDFDDAMHCYRMALKLSPTLAGARNNLGYLYNVKGKWLEAAAELRQAVTNQPDLFQAHHSLGDSLRAMGQVDQALESYRKAAELRPDFAESWRAIGKIEFDRRRLAKAADAMRKVVELQPTSMDYSLLSAALMGIDEIDSASESLKKAIELEPDRAEPHFGAGGMKRRSRSFAARWR